MKLFAIEGCGHYGGGIAVIRAMTKERALELAAKIEDRDWNTDYSKPRQVIELPSDGEGVLHHFETGE